LDARTKIPLPADLGPTALTHRLVRPGIDLG